MKIFLAQPMGTRTAEEVRDIRKPVQTLLEERGHEILDNVFTDEPSSDVVNPEIYYLSKAVTLLTKADLVIFLPGWQLSTGCLNESKICKDYNVPALYTPNSDILDLACLQTIIATIEKEGREILLNKKSYDSRTFI